MNLTAYVPYKTHPKLVETNDVLAAILFLYYTDIVAPAVLVMLEGRIAQAYVEIQCQFPTNRQYVTSCGAASVEFALVAVGVGHDIELTILTL